MVTEEFPVPDRGVTLFSQSGFGEGIETVQEALQLIWNVAVLPSS